MPALVGLGGVTCGGKTTLAAAVARRLVADGFNVKVINQDEFCLEPHQLPMLPDMEFWNFDVVEAYDWDALQKRLSDLRMDATVDVVIALEGILVLEHAELNGQFDRRYFLTLDYAECEARRVCRTYVPPDVPGFFDKYAWPAYVDSLRAARERNDCEFVDAAADGESTARRVAAQLRRAICSDWISLTHERIRFDELYEFVCSPDCGAISTFIGTTRDGFQGKAVLTLEYEAYEPMAVAEMRKICAKARADWPTLKRIAVAHRLGVVPVCEASIMICVSSPHRKEAQQASRQLIDELKLSVPIWKKEVYADGTDDWKSNAECKWTDNDHVASQSQQRKN